MPTIIAIEKLKRGRRASVHLDSEEALSLRLDVLQVAGLYVGAQLTVERQQELEAEDQRLGAVEAALRLLASGPRSEHDLRERLARRRGFRRDAVDHALKRMRELGYLDDAAFARTYIESRQAATPRSKRALAFELSRRGVSRDQLDAVLEDVSDVAAAYAAAQRRLRSLRGLDRVTFERRLGSFLNGRGFSYGVSRSTVERCWSELARHDGGEQG